MASRPPARKKDPDSALVDDIRLLGRILGDVIREQEGVAIFNLIEQIRVLSVRFHRHGDENANKELKKLLKGLSADDAVKVIRAFTYFSHLANLAEDRHQLRRQAAQERIASQQPGSIDLALERIHAAGISKETIVKTLTDSYLSPVLTAHPTEVQRKSILDAERNIAQLLLTRDQIKDRAKAYQLKKDLLCERELTDNELQIKARVIQLWQTVYCVIPN